MTCLSLGSLGDDLESLNKCCQDTPIDRTMHILEELGLVRLAHALEGFIRRVRLGDLEVLGDLQSLVLVGRDDSEDVRGGDCGCCYVSIGDFLDMSADTMQRVDHIPLLTKYRYPSRRKYKILTVTTGRTHLAQIDILSDLVLDTLDDTPIILYPITLLESQALEADAEEEVASE
jgi:hypothetical protein